MKFPILLFGILLCPLLNAQNYCSSSGNISNFEWIERVKLTNIIHTSGNNNGYADFTNFTANVFRGAPVTLTLTPGISENNSTPNEFWKVWIDYNHDGDFTDPNELVFSEGTQDTTAQQVVINIPYSATPGVTRMRVTLKFVNEDNPEPTPCDDFLYGEVEDYSVNIQTPPNSTSTNEITTDIATFDNINNILSITNPEDFNTLEVYNLNGQLELRKQGLTFENNLPIVSQLSLLVLTDNNNKVYYKKVFNR